MGRRDSGINKGYILDKRLEGVKLCEVKNEVPISADQSETVHGKVVDCKPGAKNCDGCVYESTDLLVDACVFCFNNAGKNGLMFRRHFKLL